MLEGNTAEETSAGSQSVTPPSADDVIKWAEADALRREKNRSKGKSKFESREGVEVSKKVQRFTVVRTGVAEEAMVKGAPIVGISGSRPVKPENIVK